MSTKTLITKNAAAVWSLQNELDNEKNAYNELQEIYTNTGYGQNGITFHEHIIAPLRTQVPGADESGLLKLFGKEAVIARAEELKRQIKHYELHTPEALEAHLQQKVYEYAQTDHEVEILTFLKETRAKMVALGLSKKQRIELLEVFGVSDNDLDEVSVWRFRDSVSKCADRKAWNVANPTLPPL